MKMLLLGMFVISINAYAGGGATVGDGGHVVVCNGHTTLLDIYEMKVADPKATANFSNQPSSLITKIDIGINRIWQHFGLSADETTYLKKVAHDFFKFNSDPWINSDVGWNSILNTKDISIERNVYDKIKKEGCYIEIIAIRPTDQHLEHHPACLQGAECLLLNKSTFSKLDPDQRGCLFVHELLRYLPARVALKSESELRSRAAQICANIVSL